MLQKLNQKIEEIKQKPEHIRKRYVWVLTTICTLLIGGIWVSTFSSNFNADSSLFKNLSSEDTEGAFDNINDGLADIKDAVNSIGDENTDNPFATDNNSTGNEEARLPAEGESIQGSSTSDGEVISDETDTELNDYFNEGTDTSDFTEEELREYLKRQEEDFREEMEEDLGGGMLP